MTDYTDGSSFVGLDSACYAADQAVGTWLGHRLHSNVATIAQLDSYNWNPYVKDTDALNTNTGHRPYLAIGSWQSILTCDVWVEPGMNGMVVSGCYNVQSEGTLQNDVKARLSIEGVDPHAFTFANTDSAGTPSFEDVLETWTFTEPTKTAAGWRRMTLEIQSEPGESSGTVTVQAAGKEYLTANNGDISAPPSSGPSSSSPEVKYIVDSKGVMVEWLAVDLQGTSEELVFTWPTGDEVPLYTGSAISFYNGAFLQVRSLSFQPTYEASTITKIVPSDLSALLPESGLTAAYHGEAVRRLNNRPRCLAVGPSGVIHTVDESWPDDYAQMWTYVQGDGTNQTDALIDEPVFIDGENPRIVARMLMVGMFRSGSSRSKFRTSADAGLASWDLTLKVSQMQDGDASWAGASYSQTNTDTVRIPIHSADSSSRALYIMDLLHDHGNRASAAPENYAFVFREGSLTGNDYDLIQVVEVSLDLTGWTTNQLNAARLEVTGALNTIIDLPWTSETGASYTEERLRLTCVGFSCWSRQDG